MQWLWVMSFLPDPGKQLLNRGLRTESLGIETRHYLGTYIRILYTMAIAMCEMPLHHSSVKWCYIYTWCCKITVARVIRLATQL